VEYNSDVSEKHIASIIRVDVKNGGKWFLYKGIGDIPLLIIPVDGGSTATSPVF
jgi:hypothetical protein